MISSIYETSDPGFQDKLLNDLKNVVEARLRTCHEIKIFFRADDIAVPSFNYDKMINLFLNYRVPLCLAVVPAWLTDQRWSAMRFYRKKAGSLFCWHMHGYRHQNHETEGKKQEFGPQRSKVDIVRDLKKGYERLLSIMGDEFTPIFTPPWNRCSRDTMEALLEIGFDSISRSNGAEPEPPENLIDIPVHVDLHTRKEKDPCQGRKNLITEFENGLSQNTFGIMLHHQRMNENAFFLLDKLLKLLNHFPGITIVNYNTLI